MHLLKCFDLSVSCANKSVRFRFFPFRSVSEVRVSVVSCMHAYRKFFCITYFIWQSLLFLANFASTWLSQMIYPPRKWDRRRLPPKPPTQPLRLHAFNRQQMPQTHKGSPMATSSLPTTQAAAATLRAPVLVVHDAGVGNRTRT